MMSDNNWDWEKLSSCLNRQLAVDIFLSYEISRDKLASPTWKLSSNGEFKTYIAWNLIRGRAPVNKMLQLCWDSRFIVTISLFWLEVLHKWLPVEVEM